MTPKQREIKARKFRLIAGGLYVEMNSANLPPKVREEIRVAHDAMCRAFGELERELDR